MYAGSYYGEELNLNIKIEVGANSLNIFHPQHGLMVAEKIANDIFTSNWPLNIIEFCRDSNNNINGLKISNGRTRDVMFHKR